MDTFRLRDPLNEMPRCPRCGAARPTLHLQIFVFPEARVNENQGLEGWAVYQCSSCNDIIAFKATMPWSRNSDNIRKQINGHYEVYPTEMMPNASEDFNDWPERAATYMRQALEALGAPDGAVMLAGSAVDAMLKEKGYQDGSVHSRIERAVKDNVLTADMGAWAHEVRLAANAPRHADRESPHATKQEALAALEFTRALAQFLFILPARVERGKQAALVAQPQDSDCDDVPPKK